MPDLARWMVATEMLLLFVSLVAIIALEPVAAARAPRSWRWGAGAVLVLVFGVTVAVVLNALVAGPQTPGVKLLAGLGALSVTLAVVAVVVAVVQRPTTVAEHREAAVVANARPLAQALSHLQHLEPCGNPDCTRVRRELRTLAGDDAA